MENQKPIYFKWAVTIAVLIAAVSLLYVSFLYNLPRKFNYAGPVAKINTTQKDIYTSLASYTKDTLYPFVQTDIDNVFYVARPNKDIEFFEFSQGKFTQINSSKKIELSITCCSQKIPVNISYIIKDGKTIGYGTFVSEDPSAIYKYAFFKLCNKPDKYISGADLLLLVDFDYKDVFKSNKDYSEVFGVNSSTKKVSKIFSVKGRSFSVIDAKLRDDFFVLDDNILKSCKSSLLFLSSRSYKQSSGIYGTDIFYQTEYTDSPKLFASDILDGFVRKTNNGIIYFKNTSDKNSSKKEFSLILKDKQGKERIIKTFEGEFDKTFLRCGDYLIDKGTMTLYNLVDNTESVLLGISMNNLLTFAVSPDQTKVILAGNFNNGLQKLVFYDLSIKRFKSLEQQQIFFDSYPNLCFIDNDTVSYIAPAKMPDMTVCNFIISWKKVFSTLA
ncbi:MAG: hypothetical protein EOM05_00780 [Clostridia bacterium]|nr:hypothetical protein [Clostridia bacterium]